MKKYFVIPVEKTLIINMFIKPHSKTDETTMKLFHF